MALLFHTSTVRPKKWDPDLLYSVPHILNYKAKPTLGPARTYSVDIQENYTGVIKGSPILLHV